MPGGALDTQTVIESLARGVSVVPCKPRRTLPGITRTGATSCLAAPFGAANAEDDALSRILARPSSPISTYKAAQRHFNTLCGFLHFIQITLKLGHSAHLPARKVLYPLPCGVYLQSLK